MRYSKEHKEQTRARIFDAALRKFRSDGYCGIGVDGMAKAAGVTSGAFYVHFESKSEAFQTVVVEGLVQLREAIENRRENDPDNWVETFTRWYFSVPRSQQKKTAAALLPMQGGCALPTLSPEVVRAGDETREAYQEELLLVVDTIADGLPDHIKGKKDRRNVTWAMLSVMIGGVILGRSVHDKKLVNEISKAAVSAIDGIKK